ncbi:iron-siderophore ABC transporter substrate-binding protein [Microlunatus speluncae]|uniref:iron-siderophore ABC transporter substrate-binding protein n=1 Tax=Microlunatus speluncae TaxID=2594267 RepID=UPI001FE8B81C|nr:iron-siderophore ABC transporter substrate-binding protein [Microlunatus speluncae]
MTSFLSRRRMLTGSVALGLGASLGTAGCNSTAETPSLAGPSGAGSGFPVTVEHKYGSTTVPAAPQRIVSVGLTEQDTLFALGLTPVAVTEWYGDRPHAIWPWAEQAAAGAKPEVLSTADGLQLERIGALEPDLILGTNAGLSSADYARLSEFAPTIANRGGFDSDNFEPWTVQTELIGNAVGKAAETTKLITDLRDRFARAAADHPQFAGKKAVFLQAPYYEGKAIAYQDGLSTAFLTDLGFVIPPVINEYATDGGQAQIPVEKLDILDEADVLVWATEDDKARAELARNELFGRLRAVREGHSIYTGGVLAAAIYFATVLSLPYVLDTLVPMLETP